MPNVQRRAKDGERRLPPVTVSVLDFGGHVEYASMQAAFLTSGCVAVLTMSVRRVLETPGQCHAEVQSWVASVASRLDSLLDVTFCVMGTHVDEVCAR